ncbi:hypothetical protein [Pseudomonas fulva]|uniref:hypothetical protein n=1 Tax=Pseudomonas fulva TaxID=47880 RepID=UPI002DB80CBB|nr:hypothetical protein [Pseudomonas fulva]MEB8055785.1 hypothetical protein [Pseudomonas fulva]
MSECSVPTKVVSVGQYAATEPREFDRSQVFMVCIQNFDDHRRLSVTMLGGRRFEIDSRECPYDLDEAVDWLMGEA